LAILKHEIPETEYYELEPSKRDFQVGDSLTAVGYPDIYLGDKLNVRPGYITSLPTRSAVPMIEVTQKLTQGMSGGPVIDENNGVAGIIHKGGPNEGRDLAVHIKSLIEWLNEP
jgi:RNA-directed DNA polymerase